MGVRLVAGVDCSTQATKVLVVDVESGFVVASGRAPHEVTGSGGARETDPRTWWTALRDALSASGHAREVDAISVAGQQHGLVVLDEHGEPLRPAVLWNDTRSAPDAVKLLTDLGGPARWAAVAGSIPTISFTVTRWAWLRRTEPAAAEAARAVRLPHDYLTERLTGRAVTDRSDASGTCWWSTITGDYLPEVLEHVGLERRMLPEVLGPFDVAGRVTEAASSELGLAPGTLVGPGTGDNAGAALGLGLAPGEPVISLGTSGTAYVVSTRPAADPTGTVAGFADACGRFLPLAATLNCTVAVDRFAAWLGIDRETVEPSLGVTALPYLDGERTPYLPTASGMLVGLRHGTTAGAILMAAYEGAMASLVDALDALERHSSGIDRAAPLVVIGGGSRGHAWREVCARLSGRRLLVPASQEHVALGAAVQAAAILTGAGPAEIASRWRTRQGVEIEAVPQDTETLERIRTLVHTVSEGRQSQLG